jgi:hypothetical protein
MCPALSEGETPAFRIQPVGPNTGELVFLSAADFSTVSQVDDRASKKSSPNWHEVQQTLLNTFYEPKTKRG